MRFGIKSAISLFLLLLPAFFPSLRAQSLPSLPKASEVVTGTLPNGISYYLVTNPAASKGFADFALVQKGAVSEEAARAALTRLPHFQGSKPYQFLAKLGVGYKNYGFITSSAYSSSYRLSDVPVSRQADRDTVLLMLFDISETCPYEQAIVVSGDIDKAVIQERMNVFSMMVTHRDKAPAAPSFEWQYPESLQVERVVDSLHTLASIEVSYLSARTARNLMNTTQPLVTSMFSRELGLILTSRLQRAFKEADIPVASMTPAYRSSADGPTAERYSIDIRLAPKDVLAATGVISTTLARMDAHGASLQEFLDSKETVLSSLRTQSATFSNAEWIDRCSSAFLYGSSLASRQTMAEFFSTRSMEPSRELELFNTFASALLDPSKAVKVTYSWPDESLDPLVVADSFSYGWERAQGLGAPRDFSSNRSDTLSLASPKGKSKLKKVAPEPMTGGEMWTFANGMRVIYKKDASRKGMFSYGMMLRGGFSEVPELHRGEGGFVSDLLLLSDVAGMSPDAFGSMLTAAGISLTPEVSVSDLRLSGTAPSSSFQLLMKSLVSLSRERQPDAQAFDYYRQCEALRLSGRAVEPVLDSIMRPDFRLTAYKDPLALGADLQERAERYFEGRFSRCDDGVLVLVGDLDPYLLKKMLPRYVSGFRTGGQVRPAASAQYVLRSGWSTYTFDTEDEDAWFHEPCIEICEAVLQPFTADNLLSYEVAMLELRKAVNRALAEEGMYAEVHSQASVFPAEEMTLRISVRRCDEAGLPEGVTPQAALQVLGTLRSALSALSSSTPSADSVKDSKALLLSRYDAAQGPTGAMIDATLMRYSAGKDFLSGYKTKINAVTPASVAEIFKALDGGSRVELVVY